ncbi:hypothetical protein VTO42DRAFT_8488 [Malbranchea cinnamomea]
MPHQPATETAVSAPGKVLLTGGYLVLDRQYTGAVYALDARIHVIVQQLKKDKDGKIAKKLSVGELKPSKGDGEPEQDNPSTGSQDEQTEEVVIVKSPQFLDALWEYRVTRVKNGGGVKVVQLNDGYSPRNSFVEASLNYALTYINYVAASSSFGSLSVTILADNDYYSETAASLDLHTSPGLRFKKFGVRLHEAHKTGLGSSAALVTALVSALVIHRTVHPEEILKNRSKLHNLAQAAHCAAQGKVGSGFDVAAAVYGTCLYRRFSPAVLEDLGDVGSPQFEERLFAVVENLNSKARWDAQCGDIGRRLPRGLQLVLCDVDCGSKTPGMVKKVLTWRENKRQEADMIWNALQRENELLYLELQRLARLENPEREFNELRNLLFRCRVWIQKMTSSSQVPIEPRVQTELLDALSGIDGVIGGVVPGAGGYDAVALLVRDEKEVAQRLFSFVQDWKCTVEDDFGGKIGRVRLLGVTHGAEGMRNELPANYSEWL